MKYYRPTPRKFKVYTSPTNVNRWLIDGFVAIPSTAPAGVIKVMESRIFYDGATSAAHAAARMQAIYDVVEMERFARDQIMFSTITTGAGRDAVRAVVAGKFKSLSQEQAMSLVQASDELAARLGLLRLHNVKSI